MTQKDSARYSYAWRRGVLPISWEDYFAICKGLARAVASFQPDSILGIARGGLYPATLLSNMLRSELYTIRITSRFRDVVVYQAPVWLVRPPAVIVDQKVLIVDDICSEGLTLTMAKEEVVQVGAREVRSAVMYAHERAKAVPDYIGIISDALILNPWDREIVQDGTFAPHPEYVDAFKQQGITPPPPFLHGIDARDLDKEA
jgi:uncharacterized protein